MDSNIDSMEVSKEGKGTQKKRLHPTTDEDALENSRSFNEDSKGPLKTKKGIKKRGQLSFIVIEKNNNKSSKELDNQNKYDAFSRGPFIVHF